MTLYDALVTLFLFVNQHCADQLTFIIQVNNDVIFAYQSHAGYAK